MKKFLICALALVSVGALAGDEIWDLSLGTGTLRAERAGVRTGYVTLSADIINAKSNVISATEPSLRIIGSNGAATVLIQGGEGKTSTLTLKADDGDDAADVMSISFGTDGITRFNGTTGTNTIMTLNQGGDLAIDGALSAATVTSAGAVLGQTSATFGGNTVVGGKLAVSNTVTMCTNLTVCGTVIKLLAVPTSSNGLDVGTLYNDSGTLKLVP